jgi:hypothetical protein
VVRVEQSYQNVFVHAHIAVHDVCVVCEQHGLLLVDTKELEEKMAGFSFNPDITTHEQLVAFHLQQRLASADRTTPKTPKTPDTPDAPDTPETPQTPETPHTPYTPAVVCNTNADSSEALPAQFGGSSVNMVLVWGSPAVTVCCVLLVVWVYLRRSSSPPRPAPPRKPELAI